MVTVRVAIACIVLCLGCSPSHDLEAQSAAEEVVAFTEVNVIPMDRERILERQTVVVRDGMIAEVGAFDAVAVPPEAVRIHAPGQYLLPGLTDSHIHLRSTDELVSYVAHGVTAVIHMSGAMSGAPDILKYRENLRSGALLGPMLFTTGPILDGDPPIFAGVSEVVTTAEEARQAVAEQRRAGYDFIKVYNNLTPDVLAAVTDAAHDEGMAVVGHIPRKAGRDRALQQALDAGLDLIAHGEEFFFTFFHSHVDSLLDEGQVPHPDSTGISEAVRLTREAGTSVTPNLSFVAMTRIQLDSLDSVLNDPETRFLHPGVLDMWMEQNPTRRADIERFDRREQAKYAFLKKLTKALSDEEIPLLLGTDASAPGVFPGKSAHLELQELVDAGLTPYEALATATLNAGAFIDEHVPSSEPFGTVAPGQLANLILVSGNPLDDIRNIEHIGGVLVQGRWKTSAELARLREEIAASYRHAK